MFRCMECGNEINQDASNCPNCGCPIEIKAAEETDTYFKINVNRKMKFSLESTRNWIALAILCFAIIAIVFFYKAYNVKNNYYNSEYSTINKNAYVGGDAYNYIINGSYFTAYSVLGAANMLCAIILYSRFVLISIKIREYEVNLEELKAL